MRYLMLFLLLAFAVDASEEVPMSFDGREWKLGYSKQPDKGEVFNEYVLPGETVHNWSELVTIQFFPELHKQVSLDSFELYNKQAIMQACPNAIWESLSHDTNERMWQFTVKNCPGQHDQSEIVRAVQTNEGVHVFHYAIKEAPISEKLKETWTQNLKAIQLT